MFTQGLGVVSHPFTSAQRSDKESTVQCGQCCQLYVACCVVPLILAVGQLTLLTCLAQGSRSNASAVTLAVGAVTSPGPRDL